MPTISTRTPTLFPYPTLFRVLRHDHHGAPPRLARPGGAEFRVPAVLSAGRAVGGAGDGSVGSDADGQARTADHLRSGDMARTRVPVRLPRCDHCRVPADRRPQLDRAVACDGLATRPADGSLAGRAAGGDVLSGIEIGRASCGERGCHYV